MTQSLTARHSIEEARTERLVATCGTSRRMSCWRAVSVVGEALVATYQDGSAWIWDENSSFQEIGRKK